jgi:hypothetical protein
MDTVSPLEPTYKCEKYIKLMFSSKLLLFSVEKNNINNVTGLMDLPFRNIISYNIMNK